MRTPAPGRSRLDGGPLPLVGYIPSDTDVRARHLRAAHAALMRFADDRPARVVDRSLVLETRLPGPHPTDPTGVPAIDAGPLSLTLRYTTDGRTAILVRSRRKSVGRLLVDHGADALRAALDAPGDHEAARRAYRLIVDGTLDMIDAYMVAEQPDLETTEATETLLAAFHWHAVDRTGETLPLAAHAPYADLPSRCWSQSDRRWIDADLDAPARDLLARVDAAAGRYFTVAVIENSDPAGAFQLTFDRHELSLPRPDSFEAIRTLAGFDRPAAASVDWARDDRAPTPG